MDISIQVNNMLKELMIKYKLFGTTITTFNMIECEPEEHLKTAFPETVEFECYVGKKKMSGVLELEVKEVKMED